MKTYDEMEFHPDAEKLVQILCDKTQNSEPLFFRVLVAYYFCLLASMMRTKIDTLDRGVIPVNLYAINLAVSGAGKGHATNVMEEEIIGQFRHTFTDNTFPLLAQKNLPILSLTRAARKNTDPDIELKLTEKEFEGIGPLLFTFDSGTTPAVKQARQKLLMANAGSMNMQIDEIGSNLMGNMEILSTFLELYDKGKVKPKLVKNTAENARHEEIVGDTPTNMMLFGTPSRLLNGGKTEEEFNGMLEEGYARRCFFGYARKHKRKTGLTPDQIFSQRTDATMNAFMKKLSQRLAVLADISNVDTMLQMNKKVSLLFIEYQLKCEKGAESLGEHEEMRKAELSHRHFKALKLAGAYAFIDSSPEITEKHAYNAIKLAEESGKAFEQILSRDRPYVKLAKYIASIARPVTQADLVEDLPFYRGSQQQKSEMMQLAIAYGYQNCIVIKKAFEDGIEFMRGETLKSIDLNKILISYSDDLAKGYQPDFAAFEDLHKLTQLEGKHWCSHHFKDGHRTEENALPGFNIVVLDIDGGVNLSTAKMLLRDYKALFYTTKRSTKECERFRIVLPMNYELKMDAKDYKEFMVNLSQWLPFDVDPSTGQRSRKWLSHNGHYEYQDGQILDILPFIPKTSKNDDFKSKVLDQQGMDNLERWVINNTGDGNRNNMLLRFAMILVDGGFLFDTILSRVSALNDKLADKLEEAEIMATIMVSVSKAIGSK